MDCAEASPPPSSMVVPDVEYIVPPPGSDDFPSSQSTLKRHKVLPHPRSGSERVSGKDDQRKSSGFQSHHTLRHQRRKISGGPDLPPTPPAHSRNSSSSHSIIVSSSLTLPQTPDQSSDHVPAKTTAPSTPPNQRSPPTPDVTPPQSGSRLGALRPPLYDRIPSKSTTHSRTESFKTARETPLSSESSDSDTGDGKSTLRPPVPSARTSQNTVRRIHSSDQNKPHHPPQAGLGLGVEFGPENRNTTPKSKREFISFDGEWGSGSEVEQEWDDNLRRNVTVRKRRPETQVNAQGAEVVDDTPVSPTNATKAVRALPLHGRILTYSSPRDTSEPSRHFTAPTQSIPESSINVDVRRLSGMSTKSNVSTIVEAILVDTSSRQRKTLRHVKRVSVLRDSSFDVSSSTSSPMSASSVLVGTGKHRRLADEIRDAPRESYVSNGTVNSISSRKARREIWKNGAIPVVVVPDRRSSNRSSSRERSLRSTSSKRSKRSPSLNSVPLSQTSKSHDLTPYFDRPAMRGRTMSESDGSAPGDQRTIDHPPIVPRRTSSLSAPTSRNASKQGSRTGSLTAESLKAHDALLVSNGVQLVTSETVDRSVSQVPVVTVEAAPTESSKKSSEEHLRGDDHRARQLSGNELGIDRHGKRSSSLATPFSVASGDTTGTSAAEISEALAVSIVPHQNRSVLVVDHKHSDGLDGDQISQITEKVRSPPQENLGQPIITTTKPDGLGPVTPPQAHLSMDDVDSPLRNPRAPPPPPAIKFIPATPSGLTPVEEKTKMLGNYFEEVDEKPIGAISLVRRALSGRRNSSYGPSPVRESRPGFLTRTFSLSRNIRRDTAENPDLAYEDPVSYPYPYEEDQPRDETRLYPGWRPARPDFSDSDDDGVYDMDHEHEDDHRPPPPKRSLSSRMQRVFAVMPLQDSHDRSCLAHQHDNDLERRTIRRSSNGNLRVVKHRRSVGPLRHSRPNDRMERPYTAPEGNSSRFRRVLRSYSLSRNHGSIRSTESKDEEKGSGRFGRGITEYNLRNLPRRLSEKRREKRSEELRQKISGPREVRDGVGDVVRRN